MTKRYYWIKLKQDFYENNDAVDFLMTQADGNGAKYVVLYHMLCLKTVNTGGGLYSKLGEMIVPYDVDKIVRDCKYFERYIVTQALQLYKTLGLIYEEKNGKYLTISDFESLIGSESDSAGRVRKHRNKTKALQCNENCNATVTETVTAESEIEKEIDIYTTVVVNAREVFCKTYDVTDDDTTTDGIDFDALSKAYTASEKWLQTKPYARRMSWVVKHYNEIIAGKFTDFAKSKTSPPTKPSGKHHVEVDT